MSRLAECLELMARDDIDILVLGREANARTVTDAARLWLAGTRAFSPGCVVVRRTGAAHVLANTDAVVPPGFPIERLYGVTWNPDRLVAALAAIDGVREARRVGVDGMTPGVHVLLGRAVPDAELVDAAPLFAALWSVPEADKVAGVERAGTVAAAGLAAMRNALQPGATPRTLRGVCALAFAAHGVTTPAFDAVAAPLGAGSSTWLPPERGFAAGERVVLRAGVLRDGWEASLARTYVVGTPSAEQAAPDGWEPLVAACTSGTTVGALRGRGAVVHGLGRGVEPWPDDLVLVPGLVAALELHVGASLHQDVVTVR